MNLVDGKIMDTQECGAILDQLEHRINHTLSKRRLEPELVLNACDKLVSGMDVSIYLKEMAAFGIDEALGRHYIDEARQLFSKESLTHRLKIELGEVWETSRTYRPMYKPFSVTERTVPLGALLHIAAGNADGLPAFSVLEGLLSGNINILKLPAEEGGISVRLLMELIRIEPLLSDYIYVFDYSSKDIEHIQTLISAVDAVVVWGGKEAVSAIRSLVPPHIRLIEWGHKISFCYVTPQGMTEDGLRGLARNMVTTDQLLCSSAQGIFVDTEDMTAVHGFCAAFLPILEEAFGKRARRHGIGIRSQTALRVYSAELERIYRPCNIFKGETCSLIAYPDQLLETSIQFGNAWVRPLPEHALLSTLRPYKNYLQTVGLLCAKEQRDPLAELLFKTGVVRVCAPEQMSAAYCGAPHDGDYSLRRYTKVVTVEQEKPVSTESEASGGTFSQI